MRHLKLSLPFLALAGLSGVSLLHRSDSSGFFVPTASRALPAAAVVAEGAAPVVAPAALIEIEPERWDVLARAARVFRRFVSI
ncbi:MAG: hypothetical protein IPL39_09195 [Opitutaceae bacterium]|nr:hypothetical protein [Opitutaceae bacterium]